MLNTNGTISETAVLLSSRQVSPVELVDVVCTSIDRLDPALRSYVSVHGDKALQTAREAEAEIGAGRYRGPLHGIPIGIKDNIAVGGWPTTNGSALMEGCVTDYDATVVARLKSAGAIILGKNNMHEWAMGGTCTNMAYGTVRNPWDLDRIPGGSSGGSAAAVSAGLAFASVGTDGMGSIRMPAAYCGVVGLKPTYARVSRYGELPPTMSWIDHIGPITRSVRDAGLMLEAMEGFDSRDPTSRSRPRDAETREANDRLKGLRVGVIENYFPDDLVPEMAAAFAGTLKALEAAGAELSRVRVPSLQQLPLTLLGIYSEREAFLLDYALSGRGFASDEIRMRILAAQFVTAADHRRAMCVRSLVAREVRTAFAELDVVATPVTSTAALPIGAKTVVVGPDEHETDLSALGVESRLTVRLTYPFNVLGYPAISVPAGYLDGDLPWGLQLCARPWQDEFLLEVAATFEDEIGAGYRPPPLLSAILEGDVGSHAVKGETSSEGGESAG